MKLQDSRYCIVTANPQIMVISFEITLTCYRSKVITTSGLAAAILIYVNDYTKNLSNFYPIVSARLGYVDIGRKMLAIIATNAEI